MSKREHDDKRRTRWQRLLELVAEAAKRLEAAGHPQLELERREVHTLRPGEMLLMDRGFLHLSPTRGDARTARAPCMAGLLEEAVAEPVDIVVEGLDPSRGFLFAPGQLYDMASGDGFFHKLLYGLYEYELWRLTDETRSYRKHLHDFYAPNTAALLPGPYDADDVHIVGLLMETEDRCWAKRHLPPGVWRPPGLRNNYLIVMAHFSDVACRHPKARGVTFDYRETTVFIPAVAGWRPGAFSPILFPDNAMAITLGREIYGFPKRFGRTQLEIDRKYAELEVDDKLQFWCTWDEAETVPTERYVDRFVEEAFGNRWWADKLGDAAGFFFRRLFEPDRHNTWPPMSVFVRKQLPDVALPCEKDLVYESDGLVRVPFDVSDVKHCELLHGLRFEPGREASFLPPSRCLLAGHATMDMGFGVRQELHSYLGPMDHAALAGRKVKRTAQRAVSRGHGLGILARDLVREVRRPSQQQQPHEGDDQG
jgi:hypothetical protein